MPLWCLRLPELVRRRAEQRNPQPCRITCVSAFKAACAIEIKPRSETEFGSGVGLVIQPPQDLTTLRLHDSSLEPKDIGAGLQSAVQTAEGQVECGYSAGS